jgi:hypothetical protein
MFALRATSIAALLACCAALACAATLPGARIPHDPRGPQLVNAPFGDLVEQWVDAPGNLYVRRPRPDFTAYRALRFEQPSIFYDVRVTPPLVQDHSILVRSLADAVRAGVGSALPFAIAAKPGPGVLRVRAEVTELEFDRARVSNSRVTSIIQPGASAMFVLEIADDETGTPLLRVAARRQMPGGIFTGPWAPDIDRSQLLFRGFASDTRECLAHVVRPVAAPASE